MKIVARLVAILLPVAGAAAQTGPGDFAPPKTGLVVVYDTVNTPLEGDKAGQPDRKSTTMTVLGVEGDIVLNRVEIEGQPAVEARTLRAVMTVERASAAGTLVLQGDLAPVRALWPLAEGKTARFAAFVIVARRDTLGQLGAFQRIASHEETWTVEKRETVESPAGRFDAIVLKRDYATTPLGGAPVERATYRVWLAPALGWYVRFEGVQSQPVRRKTEHLVREIRGH